MPPGSWPEPDHLPTVGAGRRPTGHRESSRSAGCRAITETTALTRPGVFSSFLGALHHVAQTAAARDLALPESLSAWAQWVVAVGRLSFPTGRIVSTLDRQHPLPTRPDDATP